MPQPQRAGDVGSSGFINSHTLLYPKPKASFLISLYPPSTAPTMPPSSTPLPSNVHTPMHPCQLAKISLLRSKKCTPKETKALIHDITLILGVAVLARTLSTEAGDTVCFVSFIYFAFRCSLAVKLTKGINLCVRMRHPSVPLTPPHASPHTSR